MKREKIYRKLIRGKWLGVVGILLFVVSVVCLTNPSYSITQAEYNRYTELTAQGYSPEVAFDQVQEEFHGVDGPGGTGGIDGKLIGGGSGSGGSSGSGGQATPKPTEKPTHTHEYAEEITKPNSCTEDGVKTFKCSCGASYTEVLPAYGHDYQVDPSKHTDATCTQLATETMVCTDCGDEIVQPYGELAEHDYQLASDSKEATCMEPGKLHWVCSVCGDEYYEDVDALGHDWDSEYTIVKSASCAEDGLKEIRCKRCGEVKEGSQVVIPATGHLENPDHQVTQATFFEDGLEIVTCMRCGEVMSETVIPKKMDLRLFIGACCGVAVVLVVIIVMLAAKVKKKK